MRDAEVDKMRVRNGEFSEKPKKQWYERKLKAKSKIWKHFKPSKKGMSLVTARMGAPGYSQNVQHHREVQERRERARAGAAARKARSVEEFGRGQ